MWISSYDIGYDIVEHSTFIPRHRTQCASASKTRLQLQSEEKNERRCHLQPFLVPVGVGGVPADSDVAAGFGDGTPEDDSVDCWAGCSGWVTSSSSSVLKLLAAFCT